MEKLGPLRRQLLVSGQGRGAVILTRPSLCFCLPAFWVPARMMSLPCDSLGRPSSSQKIPFGLSLARVVFCCGK